ncbi:flagellar basal body protein FliL [Malaciobacter molluscorum LMG 25693]|uniref:Flagellar protein FliL n=1 Tax=Malaciobacter molluscorum LMG 25693 TaxID=870501 RepID=A0A2G1DHB8_9BACT|nr:flagellar basal body-associated FliL family protein [Malaciobacter molluscorum]AXX93432.1 flagellar motor-associated protein FliL [Malaciobacter molluscorum LMG 25693]PHO17834.1 flagellar basal body protein FliL [Malaciobacter molluscorum LMG 25693]RXJ95050.1 flagellar basal body protein FliL [Malaciobacter molluscorum]
MAEEENSVVKSGGKGLMIVLIVLIVVLLLAVGGMGYFMMTKDSSSKNNQENTQEQKEGSTSQDSYKASINDLVLNITNSRGREKLMKLSFTVKSIEPTIEKIVEDHKPEIVDIVISQISARSSEELLTVGGKALLKEELIDDINSIINEVTASNDDIKKDSIKNLYFTTFVIK